MSSPRKLRSSVASNKRSHPNEPSRCEDSSDEASDHEESNYEESYHEDSNHEESDHEDSNDNISTTQPYFNNRLTLVVFMGSFFLSGAYKFKEHPIPETMHYFELISTLTSVLSLGFTLYQISGIKNWKKITYTCSVIFFSVFTLEHIMRQYKINERPSYYLQNVATSLLMMYYTLGVYWATLSSFIHRIKFEEFFRTFTDLINPSITIVFSVVNFITGYLGEITSYDHPLVIVVGSCALISVPFVLRYYGYLNFMKKIW